MGKADQLFQSKKQEDYGSSDFTFAEIDVLIRMGYLTKEHENTFGINSVCKSSSNGFGSSYFKKTKDGEIHYSASYPTNVDVDWGTYDMRYVKKRYKTFEDFKTHKPYFEEES